VELDKGGFALGIDQAERMHAEAFHETEGARDCPVGHDPHDHVHALRSQGNEIPKVIVRRLRLRKASIRLLFDRVHHVGKLNGVLDEEHRNIVADDVPVAFLSVELYGESAHIPRQVKRAFVTCHGRETYERRGLFSAALKNVGLGDVGERLIGLEIAVRPEAAGVHDALGDALMIKVKDLLAQVEILKRSRPARTDPERVLIVGDGDALLRSQSCRTGGGGLVYFPARAGHYLLLAVACRCEVTCILCLFVVNSRLFCHVFFPFACLLSFRLLPPEWRE